MRAVRSEVTVTELYDAVFTTPEREPEEFSDETAYPIKQALAYADRDRLVLECGCGPGRVLTHLSNRSYRVVGIDIHQKSLETLKSRRPEAMVVVGDVSALPFKSGVFGTVLCFAALCYLPSGPEHGLREIRRVIARGGRLVTTMYHTNVIQLLRYLRFALRRRKPRILLWCTSPSEWRATLTANGFTPIEQSYTLYRWSIARYCPLLLQGSRFTYEQQRDGDRVPLNTLGRLLWRLMRLFPRLFANHYWVASTFQEAS